ncbi:hypothetical protein [Inconstantimicrobium porci]|uniref:hypothetical protein n=1 Tax=Inconstantimicrobium porci TaxID=2652291 RepID=UPI00240A1941|nr:hypothetical protein [Inconstantimicrobium porci]MDD6769696.1 hypothetical protein [Inconstantimicrobium porci]
MLDVRQDIRGTTGQDLNKINDNFIAIWKTLYGGLDFNGTNTALKKRIQTRWQPINGEGNFDNSHPLFIRFYVPPDTKQIVKAECNFICENYRMDSDVAKGGGGQVGLDINIGVSKSDVQADTSPVPSFENTFPVDSWTYMDGREFPAPNCTLKELLTDDGYPIDGATGAKDGELICIRKGDKCAIGMVCEGIIENGQQYRMVDLYTIRHKHKVKRPQVGLSTTCVPHNHEAVGKVDLPDHKHDLNEGIKVSTTDAKDVKVYINEHEITHLDSASIPVQNGVDLAEHCKIGEWNTIRVTTSTRGRIVVYGILELIQNFTNITR